MDWQLTVTLVLIVCASCYLARRSWRLWRARKQGCAGGCGSAPSPSAAPGNDVLVPISLEKLKVVPKGSRQADRPS